MTYIITLMPGEHQYPCEPNETILEAAMRNNLDLNYGCRRGVCGNCIGELISGSIKYPEEVRALKKCDKNSNQTVFCSAVPQSDLTIKTSKPEIEILKNTAFRSRKTPCKVVGLKKLCHDVMQLMIKLPEAINLKFRAGQYLDIILSEDDKRSFSIANAPGADDLIELHIRHVEGGEYTQYIFEEMQLGEILRIELPLGSFYLRERSERPIIMMGGGTGFAPLKGIIEEAIKQNLERPVHLFWGVRAERDLYMSELPKEWQQKLKNFKFTAVLSDPDADWNGPTGFVHNSVLENYKDLGGVDMYMSGPPIMIETACKAFSDRSLTEQHIYSDAFEYNVYP